MKKKNDLPKEAKGKKLRTELCLSSVNCRVWLSLLIDQIDFQDLKQYLTLPPPPPHFFRSLHKRGLRMNATALGLKSVRKHVWVCVLRISLGTLMKSQLHGRWQGIVKEWGRVGAGWSSWENTVVYLQNICPQGQDTVRMAKWNLISNWSLGNALRGVSTTVDTKQAELPHETSESSDLNSEFAGKKGTFDLHAGSRTWVAARPNGTQARVQLWVTLPKTGIKMF